MIRICDFIIQISAQSITSGPSLLGTYKFYNYFVAIKCITFSFALLFSFVKNTMKRIIIIPLNDSSICMLNNIASKIP